MELYPYQKQGVDWLLARPAGLLADEVGLGKTIMTLAVIQQARFQSVLVLCPSILKWQWESEIKKFLSETKYHVIDGTPATRARLWKKQEIGIAVANYELLLKDWEYIIAREWDLIVCDEATRIHNIRTKTWKILKRIPSKRRIALTGTPISNRPDELFGIIDWLQPRALGSWWDFINRYCVRNYWKAVIGYQNLGELAERIKPFMLRRRKEEVLQELPAVISSEVPFKLSDEEREVYDKLRQELLFELENGELAKVENPTTIQNTLVKMLRLRQATNHLALLGKKTKSTKMETLKELLPTILNGERKAIVFTYFSKMADILESELQEWHPLKITGDVNEEKRQEALQSFNSIPRHRLLIMTSAGQYGLNIQAASAVIHYDFEWSLAKMTQRLGRAHRIGQTETVLEYSLLAKGTIDMYVRRVLHKKQEVSDFLLGVKEIKEALTYAD